MTQAAMACSSKPAPAVGTPAPRRRRHEYAADRGEHATNHLHRCRHHRHRDAGKIVSGFCQHLAQVDIANCGLPFRQGLWGFPKRILVGRFLDIHIGQQGIVC
jgi:hypothetical protein